jgi:phosphoribosylformylglycinamidine (FGAM) synthase-like amidotransferase family enzyme
MTLERPSIVEVEWADALFRAGWADKERTVSVARDQTQLDHVTCGYLLDQTDEYILVALSVGQFSYGDSIQIPAGMVRRVTTLRKAR